MKLAPLQPLRLTAKDVCNLLRIGLTKLGELQRQGKLKPRQNNPGERRYFDYEDVRKYAEEVGR